LATLYDVRCVATTQTDPSCTSNCDIHADGFSNNARLHSGASTLTECQKACEFDHRCVAADWHSTDRECWITTNPNYQHYSPTGPGWAEHGVHCHLDRRCSITRGQCFHDILTFWYWLHV